MRKSLEIEVNEPQGRFINSQKKYKAMVSGFGAGKTFAGCLDGCLHYWQHPKVNQGYFAPTYPHIRDIYFPTIEEVAFIAGLRVQVREANKEVHFYSGKQYRGTTICRSMEKPESIVGFKIGRAHLDEFDVLPAIKAKQAWRKIIARLRWQDDAILNGASITTTPEGFRETYRLFVEEIERNPQLANSYDLIYASTYDNEENLPDDYIQSMLDTYPMELIEAYLNGKFVNLTSGTVYRAYNRERHNSNETVREGEPIRVGMDFNVTKMAATIYVVRNGDEWHAVDELKDIFDTPDMVAAIRNRYPRNRVIVYPDASGKSRKTVDASKSDITTLTDAGFEVRVNSTNPAVKDRIMSVNKRLELGKLFVNVIKCKTVAKNLEQQAYDDNGEPDKSSGFDHQNDATGYPIAYEFPIMKNTPQRVQVLGL